MSEPLTNPSGNEQHQIEEDFWNDLINDIHGKQVIPVLGSNLSTIGVDEIPIRDWLAAELPKHLKVEGGTSLNRLVGHYLMSGRKKQRRDICKKIVDLIDNHIQSGEMKISQSLRDLASITDFDLIINAGFDPFMGLALKEERRGFTIDYFNEKNQCEGLGWFGRNLRSLDIAQNSDIPETFLGRDISPSVYLYHIFGSIATPQSFAVWEEDYMEYVCEILQETDNLRNLNTLIKGGGLIPGRSLLLIGSSFNDWIVRFLLRSIRGERLSKEREASDYIVEDSLHIGEPLIFYFDQVMESPKLIPLVPEQFISELSSRWRQRFPPSEAEIFLNSLNEDMESGSFFISYSRDDYKLASEIAFLLKSKGIPVWLDQERLYYGARWPKHIENVIKSRASCFISLISAATEKQTEESLSRFVHVERDWAARRQKEIEEEIKTENFIFYVPWIIDDTSVEDIKNEPLNVQDYNCIFSRRVLREGELTSNVIKRLEGYHKQWELIREITYV